MASFSFNGGTVEPGTGEVTPATVTGTQLESAFNYLETKSLMFASMIKYINEDPRNPSISINIIGLNPGLQGVTALVQDLLGADEKPLIATPIDTPGELITWKNDFEPNWEGGLPPVHFYIGIDAQQIRGQYWEDQYGDDNGAQTEVTLERIIAHEIAHVYLALKANSGAAQGDETTNKIEDFVMQETGDDPHARTGDPEDQEMEKLPEHDGPNDEPPHIKSDPSYQPPDQSAPPGWIQRIIDFIRNALNLADPLVLDLDDSGTIDLISLANSSARWDGDEDGFASLSGWVTADDGLLALDANGNGRIDDNSELFGTMDTDGFTVLSAYDSNNDGEITSEDSIFDNLLIWQDANENAYSEEEELSSLSDWDILSIDLDATEVSTTNEGHAVTHTSTFTVDTGGGTDTRAIHSIVFETDPTDTDYIGAYDLDEDAIFLPQLRGYGIIPNLHIAMSLDNDDEDPDSLISLVTAFSELTLEDLFNETDDSLDLVTDIMYRWAGVDEVLPNARGGNMDARQLEYLEHLTGIDYANNHNGTTFPGYLPSYELEEAFTIALTNVYARFAAQGAASALFEGEFRYDHFSDEFTGVDGLDLSTLDTLETTATGLANTGERTTFWANVARVIEGVIGLDNLSAGDETALDAAITGSDGSLDLTDIADAIAYHIPAGTTWTGTSGADTHSTSTGDDILNGAAGNDILHGESGNDTVNGDGDNDDLWGDEGNDYILGGSGDDDYMYDADDGFDFILDQGAGTDRIVFGAGIDSGDLTFSRAFNTDMVITIDNGVFEGSIFIEKQFSHAGYAGGPIESILFNDTSTLTLTTVAYTMTGTNAGETLYGVTGGGATTDTIYGLGGNDTIHADAGNDIVEGGDGHDTINGEGGDDTLDGDAGNDVIDGGADNDTIDGGTGDDVINGGTGNDDLTGGAGDDEITGSSGNDTFRYTSDHDTYIESSAGTESIVLPTGITAAQTQYLRIGDDMKLWFSDTQTITISAFFTSTNNRIETLDFFSDSDVDLTTVSTVTQGTSSGETLNGTANADTIYGFDGNDTLNGNAGDDVLYGGNGNDTINGNADDDYIDGGPGDDTINGYLGNEHYFYTSGLDVITDTDGTEILELAAGWEWEDIVFRRYDADDNDLVIELNGGTVNRITINNHFVSAADSMDTLRLNDGTGDVTLTTRVYETHGTSGADTIDGLIFGGSTNEIFYGFGGNDTITPRVGNDTVYGGAGDDTITDAGGSDTYVYESGDDFIDDNAGGTDIVQLTDDWELSDVSFGRYTTDLTTLVLTFTGGDTLTLNEQFNGGNSMFETLRITGESDIDLTTKAYTTYGTASANTITGITAGGSTNDTIYGLGGNDTLSPGAGNDTVYGGDGDDSLTGGDGNDILQGDAGADTYTGGNNDDTFVFTAGLDTVTDTSGTDTLKISGGATINDITVSNHGTDEAKVVLNASVDEVIVNNLRHATAANHVDFISFDDGFVTELPNYNSWLKGTSGGDTVSGTSSNETLIGYAGNDTMTGSSGTDDMHGGSGDDSLDGGAGDDVMYGGTGTDTTTFTSAAGAITVSLATNTATGDGTDTLNGFENVTGSAQGDTITGDSSANTLNGAAGNDTIAGGLGDDAIDGGADTDTLTYAAAASAITVNLGTGSATGEGTDTISNVENVTGSANGDTITGSTAANTLNGGAGNDTIAGGAGNDTMDGGADTDTLSYAAAAGAVTVSLASGTASNDGDGGSDTISNFENVTGSANGDTITGSTAANTLTGGAGADTVNGGDGDDTLVSGSGNDTFDGGANTDTLDYSAAAGAVTVNLGTGSASNDGDSGADTISNVENVTGSANNDTITGSTSANTLSGGAGNDVIQGGDGADTIIGGLGDDTLDGDWDTDTVSYAAAASAITISLAGGTATGEGSDNILDIENVTGSAQGDTITGSSSANVLDGGAGDDTLNGGAGNDTLTGGTGTDTADYSGAGGSVTISLAAGTATGDGTDTLSGIENVIGSSSADTITGDDNANVLSGRGGNDNLFGGAGSDTASYSAAAGAVTVNLATGSATGEGTDVLSNIENVVGSSSGDTITGSNGSNTLYGGGGADTMDGGSGDDVLYGEAGGDSLTGGAGNDVLYGGDGLDSYTAGAGADTVILENATAFNNIDTLTGFSTTDGDAINISDLLTGFDEETSAVPDFVFFQTSGSDTTVSVDANGTVGGTSWTQVATILGVTGLTDEAALVDSGNLIVV